jgi:uncharacterized membrane protein
MKGHRDLELTCAAAIACAVLALAIPVEALSVLFALPLALLLPGYAIGAAALRRWRPGLPQRLVLAVGLSLATLALGSLVVNYLGGLRALPWALLMVAVTLGACRYAAVARRPRLGQRRRLAPRLPALVPALMVALGLLAAAAGVAVAFHPVSADHAVGFTELWQRNGESPNRVVIGVGNEEHEATGYDLIVHLGGGARTQVRHFELKPGARTLVPIPVQDRRRAGPIRVLATLYRQGIPNQPYRTVYGWTPSRTPAE